MKFNLYQDQKGEWRWHLVAANGAIIGDSGEGYVHKRHCLDMIHRIKRDAHLAETMVNGELVDNED